MLVPYDEKVLVNLSISLLEKDDASSSGCHIKESGKCIDPSMMIFFFKKKLVSPSLT